MQEVHVPERACGFRVAGGAYLVVPRSEGGSAVERFLIDPPVPVDLNALGVSAVGTTLVPRSNNGNQTFYVLDVVGENFYPNVADMIEEIRRYGVSRRIARTTDFSRIDRNSRLILIHARAQIDNFNDYYAERQLDEFWCPRDIPKHMLPNVNVMCCSLYWEDVNDQVESAHAPDAPDGVFVYGKKMQFDQPGMHMHRRRHEERAVVRTMPSLTYRGLRKPDGVKPQYRYAMFASFPIGLIEVVRDPAGGTHKDVVERARQSGAQVVEVDE